MLSLLTRSSNLFDVLYSETRPIVVPSDPSLPRTDWTAVMIKYCCSDAFQILQKQQHCPWQIPQLLNDAAPRLRRSDSLEMVVQIQRESRQWLCRSRSIERVTEQVSSRIRRVSPDRHDHAHS